MTTAAGQTEFAGEGRAVAIGLVIVVFATVALLGIGGLVLVLYPGPSRLDRVNRCLANEKRLVLLTPLSDPIASSASAGTVATDVESNRVTISLAGSPGEAERLVAGYRGYGVPAARLTRIDRLVALWRRPPTPSELRTIRDCTY